MKPCRQPTIAKATGKYQKCLVEAAAQTVVHTSYLILSWKFQVQLSQGRTEMGGCYHTSWRERVSQGYGPQQVNFC